MTLNWPCDLQRLMLLTLNKLFWGGREQHLLKWAKGRIHLLKYTYLHTLLVNALRTFLKGIKDVALKIKGRLYVRNRLRRMKSRSEEVFSPSRYTFSTISLLGFSFQFLLRVTYRSVQHQAVRWALCLMLPFPVEGVGPGAALLRAGGASRSSTVTVWAKLYVPQR